MAYSDFNLSMLKKQFHLVVDETLDLSTVPEITVSDFLQVTLNENIPLALASQNEKARSEFIISPVLVELRKLAGRKIGLFSGVDFSVDPAKGLNGLCDFIITRSPELLSITAPVLMLVEAKNEDIKSGIAQCIAEMIAAQTFNAREGSERTSVNGVVTTGSIWKFLKLDHAAVMIDPREYYISQVGKILAVLLHFIE